MIYQKVFKGFFLVVMGASVLSAQADVTGIWVVQGDQKVTVEYRDPQSVRLNFNGGASVLINQGRPYLLQETAQGWRVLDIDQIKQQMDMALSAMPIQLPRLSARSPKLTQPIVEMKDAGRSEVVAGIKGQVYEVKLTYPDGRVTKDEAVLANDPRLASLQDALTKIAKANVQNIPGGHIPIPEAVEHVQGKGILRYGSQMRLEKLNDAAIDSNRFELPAPPTTLGLSKALTGGH
jgi:hypothetical protein